MGPPESPSVFGSARVKSGLIASQLRPSLVVRQRCRDDVYKMPGSSGENTIGNVHCQRSGSEAADSPEKNGFEIINACFDAALKRYPNLIAIGEDVGKLGDVNQGCAGLQEKYGRYRVSDTGIRECTIIGQAIGMALRGLRPIAEIQYLDYILYALQIMSDDLAMTRWRTRGGQKAPAIIRTRGHRLGTPCGSRRIASHAARGHS